MIEKFSERLKRIRGDRGFNQSDLANKIGLRPSAIAHFESERRKPSYLNIIKLAKGLNVTIDYLLGNKIGTTAFKNEDKLNDEDREFIQSIIDMRINKK